MSTPPKPPSWLRIYMTEDDKKHGLRFNPEINAGHVLTFISLIVAGFVTWGVMDKRVAVLEEARRQQEIKDVQQDLAVKEMRERMERAQERFEAKIDRVLDKVDQLKK